MTTLCRTFVVATLWCSLAFASDTRDQALQRLSSANAEIREILRQTVANAPKVAELTRQLNALQKDPKHDAQREQELFDQILEIAPAFWFLTTAPASKKSSTFETDPAAIAKAFEAAYSKALSDLTVDCFPPNGSFGNSAQCKELLTTTCSAFSSGADGVAVPVIKDDLSIEEVPVATVEELERVQASTIPQQATNPDTAFQRLAAAYAQHRFQFCTAAALSGEFFESTQAAKYPVSPSVARYFSPIYAFDRLREECFAFNVFEAQLNLVAISSRFPKLSMLKYWQPNIDRRAKGCSTAIQNSCKRTYPIKDEVILAYVTKACEIREVTAQDIDDDVKSFAEAGLTHADQLKHSELKDTIELCKDAVAHGYSWEYVPPSTHGCSKPAPQVAKPRKPRPKAH